MALNSGGVLLGPVPLSFAHPSLALCTASQEVRIAGNMENGVGKLSVKLCGQKGAVRAAKDKKMVLCRFLFSFLFTGKFLAVTDSTQAQFGGEA